MRSVIRKRSFNSVRTYSLDHDALLANLREVAAQLASEHPEATRVVLFGSVAEDRAVPASDADILIIVCESPHRFIDRALVYLPLFAEVGVGIDVFVYTESEVAGRTVPLIERALSHGVTLFARE